MSINREAIMYRIFHKTHIPTKILVNKFLQLTDKLKNFYKLKIINLDFSKIMICLMDMDGTPTRFWMVKIQNFE